MMVQQDAVTLPSGRTARVEAQADGELALIGEGGAFYVLLPEYRIERVDGRTTMVPTGIHQAQSITGNRMTYRGNVVRFVVLGDIVEVAR